MSNIISFDTNTAKQREPAIAFINLYVKKASGGRVKMAEYGIALLASNPLHMAMIAKHNRGEKLDFGTFEYELVMVQAKEELSEEDFVL